MTFQEMVDFVRAHADTDATDALTSNLTVYARMAYNDILSRQLSWPHLEVSGTLATVAGTSTYALTSVSGPTTTLDHVAAVVDTTNNRRLMAITQTDADVFYGVNTIQGTPTAWSIVGTSIVLYPTPSDVFSLQVRGTRSEVTWPAAAGDIPDLPTPFHEAIAWYMLSSYYLAQEDPSLAGVYLNEYNSMVDKYVTGETKKSQTPRPMVVGGNNSAFGRNPYSMKQRIQAGTF